MSSSALSLARSELILGGQKSGKSRRAEQLAQQWLSGAAQRRAVLVVTGSAGDAEMAQRIARHRSDRAQRCPGLQTVEAPLQLAQTVRQHSSPETLVLVDCLTLWLSNALFPMDGGALHDVARLSAELQLALAQAPGPVVLVSNEIGLGVIPMGPAVRAFVDTLGSLHQQLAGACERVTLMVAGLPLTVKGQP